MVLGFLCALEPRTACSLKARSADKRCSRGIFGTVHRRRGHATDAGASSSRPAGSPMRCCRPLHHAHRQRRVAPNASPTVYSRNDALALAGQRAWNSRAATSRRLVVHGGGTRRALGVLEKSELRRLQDARSQLALRPRQSCTCSWMGETLSRMSLADCVKAERSELGYARRFRRRGPHAAQEEAAQERPGAPAITKQKPSAAAVAAHLSTLKTDLRVHPPARAAARRVVLH